MNQEMVIFSKVYDFIAWLIPLSMKFPRSHRFIVTKRLQDAALNFYEKINHANKYRAQNRLRFLNAADIELNTLNFYLRLVHQWSWINEGQYFHAANMTAEIGRLLGGWIKATDN
jgi:four helix bundle protein